MTIQRSWGPLINVGINPSIGRPTELVGVAGPAPYVSGWNENPDAAPIVSFAGCMLRDFRILSAPDGIGLLPGGYPFQDFGFLMGANILTADFAPSPANPTAITSASPATANVPLVLTPGTGTSVLLAAYTVPGGNNIPAGAIQIDNAPMYHPYGTSGAVQAWAGTAMGRLLVLAGSTGPVTIVGFDVYGQPISQTLAAAGDTLKGFKWVLSVIPSTSGGTITLGTIDTFEFPIRADEFCDVLIWWNNTLLTSSTGFTPADTTLPNLPTSGDSRGTFALPGAADGTMKICIRQSIRPQNSDTVFGTFGVPMG